MMGRMSCKGVYMIYTLATVAGGTCVDTLWTIFPPIKAP